MNKELYEQFNKIIKPLDCKIDWIFDGELQRKLTKTILTENPSKWRLWYICSKRIGLDLRI